MRSQRDGSSGAATSCSRDRGAVRTKEKRRWKREAVYLSQETSSVSACVCREEGDCDGDNGDWDDDGCDWDDDCTCWTTQARSAIISDGMQARASKSMATERTEKGIREL